MSNLLNLNPPAYTHAKANIVALHCSLGCGRQWSRLIESCGDEYNVIAPDLAGYGENPPRRTPRPSLLSAEAEHLHRELDALDGPIHLVGHSFGGAVAFRLATGARYARRVRSLTLIEPVLPGALLEHEADSVLYDEFAGESARICTPLWGRDKLLSLRRFLAFWNGDACWDSLSEARRAALIERVNKLTADFSAIFGATGVNAAARKLAVPTLLFSGGQSPAPTRRIVTRLTSGIPNVRHVHLPAAGHMLAITHAGEINPQILRHIAASQAASALIVPFVARRRTNASSGEAGHGPAAGIGF